MAVEQDRILLTERQVAVWREEKRKLETAISSTHQKLAEINKKLEAVAVLSGEEPASLNPAESTRSEATDSGESLPNALERIARQAPAPLTKAQLRKQLAEEGFSGERLGNYFYTCIKRLKDRQRIHVLPDGRITRSAGTASSVLPSIQGGNAG